MDVSKLRSFVVLAEHLHFGRASRSLHVSQPALTKQIRRLEAELGGALFERGTHGTKLTASGQAFRTKANDLVQRFDRLVEDGRLLATGHTGTLSIGFGLATLELVPRVIMSFRRALPAVNVSLRDMPTAEQMAALESGQLDIGFVRISASIPAGYSLLRVARDQLAIVQPASERQKWSRIEDCRDRPFVIIARGRSPGFHDHVLTLFAKQGFFPKIVQEVSEFTTALALVRAGMGITIAPVSLRIQPESGLRVAPIAGSAARWSVGACWRRANPSSTLRRFREVLEAEVKADA
ncbi:MAG TPA: LysR substrate-binding domain-containing protein [Polyangiaceae bacterium]|nr:LysR substrate-binding domain-containing protein [Polyangiaceae bacterium]